MVFLRLRSCPENKSSDLTATEISASADEEFEPTEHAKLRNMQFMIVAYDGTDSEAPARRHAFKEAHLAIGHQMIRSRNVVFSTAILDDEGETIGSMRIMQFESRAQLDDWLENEPYVINNVWQKIDIKPCRIGPSFEWVTLEEGESKLS